LEPPELRPFGQTSAHRGQKEAAIERAFLGRRAHGVAATPSPIGAALQSLRCSRAIPTLWVRSGCTVAGPVRAGSRPRRRAL